MGASFGLKNLWVIAVVTLLLCVLGCKSRELDPEDSAGKCSQEMCIFMFDLLEEQTIRLRNLEETLARTLTILTSNNQDFAATVAALKSDLKIHSLKNARNSDSVASSISQPPIPSDWFYSSGIFHLSKAVFSISFFKIPVKNKLTI